MKEKLLGLLSATIFRILGLSYRYNLVFKNDEDKSLYKRLIHNKKPDIHTNCVIAFFHQDEFCLLPHYVNKNFALMVSKSKDGEIMSTAMKVMGHIPVRGSSSKGAVAALLACIKKVREGYSTAVAVDGPRGPIYRVKDGVIAISKKLNRPIIPMRAKPYNAWHFEKAWNKARVAKPFSKIDIIIGDIKMYEKNELETKLNSL